MAKKVFDIEWVWEELINERFLPLVDNRDRYLIAWGGRGSSKSDFAAKKLVYRMLTEKYCRFILVRRQYNSIKDTQFQTLQDIIINMGLGQLFEFKLNPLEITCTNGNRILARGCDDTTKLKSIMNPTGVWYEEDIVDEKDFITITTSIRSTEADYLQELFTLNPEVDGDHESNWFWKRFFEGKNEINFRSVSKIEIKPNVFVEMAYTSHHSTYKDNKWIHQSLVAFLEDMKKTNPYYYTVYTLGRWGNRVMGGNFYKLFSMARNTGPVEYNPDVALWISFDFNVLPGVSVGIFQCEGKALRMIDEIQLPSPKNTTSDSCREIIRRYPAHRSGMFITGDPAGRHNDTRSEKGFNDYSIILGELSRYRPSLRVASLAPAVVARGNFINTIFEKGYNGIEITIGNKCHKMISDLMYGQEAPDGTKLKTKVMDKNTGIAMEKYHHFSDMFDYAVTTIFASDFAKYVGGSRNGYRMQMGKGNSRNTLSNY